MDCWGDYDGIWLKTSILVGETNYEKGSDLPVPLQDFCLLRIDYNTFALLGTMKFYFYLKNLDTWVQKDTKPGMMVTKIPRGISDLNGGAF